MWNNVFRSWDRQVRPHKNARLQYIWPWGVWGSVTITKLSLWYFLEFFEIIFIATWNASTISSKIGQGSFLKFQFNGSMVHLVQITTLFRRFLTRWNNFWAYFSRYTASSTTYYMEFYAQIHQNWWKF